MKPFKSFYRQICFLAIWSVCLQRWGWDWFVTHPKVNTDKTDKFITLHAEQRWSCFEIDEWWYSTSSSRNMCRNMCGNMCGNMGAVISGTKTFYSSHIFSLPQIPTSTEKSTVSLKIKSHNFQLLSSFYYSIATLREDEHVWRIWCGLPWSPWQCRGIIAHRFLCPGADSCAASSWEKSVKSTQIRTLRANVHS